MSQGRMFDLAGRVALVTGGSRGLGRAMSLALARCGAKVAINYLHGEEAARGALAELESSGGQGALARADATDEAAIARMIAEIEPRLGPIDILVANATCDQPDKPIEDYSWGDFQAMVDFFIKSPFLLARACVPGMKRRRWGRIINIGSEVFQRGAPNFSAYVAAKGGQSGLTRSLATELAPWGITVNMVSPGWIPVERHAAVPQEEKDAYLARVPAGRWGIPADVGAAVAFLASAEAAFVNGQNVCVNGALTVA